MAKLNPAGSAFEYRTYLGGSEDDAVTALALDRSGNVYLAGTSGSLDSPASFAAYQTELAGVTDAWMAKIGSGAAPPLLSSVSAASQSGATGLAPQAIASGYGSGLAAGLVIAGSVPVTPLGGVTVTVRDSAGTDRAAAMYFVAPGQLNYVVPAGTAPGLGSVTVVRDGQTVATGTVRILKVAPALFTANNSGKGVPAGAALTVAADGTRTTKNVFVCGPAGAGTCVPDPVDLGPEEQQVYLLLPGTGIRAFTGPITATLGGVSIPVLGAAPQSQYAGLDQVNIGPVPRSLAGKGAVDLRLTVDGSVANTVMVSIH